MSKEKSNKVKKDTFSKVEYSFIFGLFKYKGEVKRSKSNRVLNIMIGCTIVVAVSLALLVISIISHGLLPQAIQVFR